MNLEQGIKKLVEEHGYSEIDAKNELKWHLRERKRLKKQHKIAKIKEAVANELEPWEAPQEPEEPEEP